jgi:hypothetical protein
MSADKLPVKLEKVFVADALDPAKPNSVRAVITNKPHKK